MMHLQGIAVYSHDELIKRHVYVDVYEVNCWSRFLAEQRSPVEMSEQAGRKPRVAVHLYATVPYHTTRAMR